MSADEADAEAVQAAGLNHRPHFAGLRHRHVRQTIEKRERRGASPQRSQGKFRDDEGMDNDLPSVQKIA